MTMRKNGASFTAFTVDTTTGVVTLTTALNSKSITAITKAAQAVVTVGAAHGFIATDVVYISGVLGMTEINGLVGTVVSTGATTITLTIDSTLFSTYTSAGTAATYMDSNDVWDWSGTYDIPVRFDTDAMKFELTDVGIRSWESIPLIEMRGT
jgi:hypothetical protein